MIIILCSQWSFRGNHSDIGYYKYERLNTKMSILQDNTKRITSIHPKGLYTKSNIIILLNHLPIYIPLYNSKSLVLVLNSAFYTYSIYSRIFYVTNLSYSCMIKYFHYTCAHFCSTASCCYFGIWKTIFNTVFEHGLNTLIKYNIFNPWFEPF